LIEDLSRDASMGAITLLGPPQPCLAVHGSFATKLFKILIALDRPSTRLAQA
jgi:hypothetical protein